MHLNKKGDIYLSDSKCNSCQKPECEMPSCSVTPNTSASLNISALSRCNPFNERVDGFQGDGGTPQSC